VKCHPSEHLPLTAEILEGELNDIQVRWLNWPQQMLKFILVLQLSRFY